jgi:hypothetical protein
MPIDFSSKMKGAVTQTLVKSLLEDAGYRVTPLGIEEVVRELASVGQEQYLKLNLPQSLRSLPDFLVTDAAITKTWLVEVKYRRSWDAREIQALHAKLMEQASAWGPFVLLLFLGERAGDIETPSSRCGVFELKSKAGELLYRSRYKPHKWYSWSQAELRFAQPPAAVFDLLNNRIEERTLQKCCEFAAAYPGILDGT